MLSDYGSGSHSCQRHVEQLVVLLSQSQNVSAPLRETQSSLQVGKSSSISRWNIVRLTQIVRSESLQGVVMRLERDWPPVVTRQSKVQSQMTSTIGLLHSKCMAEVTTYLKAPSQ